MKTTRTIVTTLAATALLAAGSGLVACKQKEPETIKIGVTAFLTGKLAYAGKNIQRGLELGVEEINAKGGIDGREVELIIEDEGDTPAKAVSAVEKLISINGLPIIIGPNSSSSVMAVAPIANNSKVVILSPGAASPNITSAGDFVFRNRAAGSLEAVKIAKFAYEELGFKKVIVFEINEDYGPGFREVFQREFENLGGEIVLNDNFDQGDTDFRTQLLKFKKYEFDGIYVIGVPHEVGLILKQATEVGINTVFLMNNMENPELIKVAGDAAEGVYFPIPFFDCDSDVPRIRSFVTDYEKRYGEKPDLFAANGYDAIYLVKEAIEKGGYTGEGIKNALYKIKDFPVVSGGEISFDANGDVVQDLVIKTVKGGEFVVVE